MNALTKKAQLAAKTVSDPRWAAVIARSTEADGTFYYGSRARAYIAALPALLVPRGLRMSASTPHAKKPRKQASGFASAASRTSPRGLSNVQPR